MQRQTDRRPRPTVIFDFYRTLVEFEDDQQDADRLQPVVDLLRSSGVQVDIGRFVALREQITDAHLSVASALLATDHPDVDEVAVLSDLIVEASAGCQSRVPDLAVRAAALLRRVTTVRIEMASGARVALDQLAEVADLALVSNTQRAFTSQELDHFDLWGYFDAVVFSSDVRCCKPDPRPFSRCLEMLGVPSDGCVFVGDNPVDDVVGAHAVGLPVVLLDRGRRSVVPVTPMHGADHVVPSAELASLRSHLDRWGRLGGR